MKYRLFTFVLSLCAASVPVLADDVHTYLYDVHGRLIGATSALDMAARYHAYGLDAADNRLRRKDVAAAPRAVQNELRPGEILVPWQPLRSLDGRSYMVLQHDGNMVLYFGSTPLWGTPTIGGRSLFVGMQGDGNLVMYDPDAVALWASGTSGNMGARALLQNDCNFVIYVGETPVWATNTSC